MHLGSLLSTFGAADPEASALPADGSPVADARPRAPGTSFAGLLNGLRALLTQPEASTPRDGAPVETLPALAEVAQALIEGREVPVSAAQLDAALHALAQLPTARLPVPPPGGDGASTDALPLLPQLTRLDGPNEAVPAGLAPDEQAALVETLQAVLQIVLPPGPPDGTAADPEATGLHARSAAAPAAASPGAPAFMHDPAGKDVAGKDAADNDAADNDAADNDAADNDAADNDAAERSAPGRQAPQARTTPRPAPEHAPERGKGSPTDVKVAAEPVAAEPAVAARATSNDTAPDGEPARPVVGTEPETGTPSGAAEQPPLRRTPASTSMRPASEGSPMPAPPSGAPAAPADSAGTELPRPEAMAPARPEADRPSASPRAATEAAPGERASERAGRTLDPSSGARIVSVRSEGETRPAAPAASPPPAAAAAPPEAALDVEAADPEAEKEDAPTAEDAAPSEARRAASGRHAGGQNGDARRETQHSDPRTDRPNAPGATGTDSDFDLSGTLADVADALLPEAGPDAAFELTDSIAGASPDPGPADRGPRTAAPTTPLLRTPMRAAVLRAALEQAQAFTSDDGWKVLEMNLGDDQGSVTIKARREADGVAVTVGFTDPALRAAVLADADRIQQALQTQYDADVDLQLAPDGGASESGADPGTGDDARGTRRPEASGAGAEADPAEHLPHRAYTLIHGTRREWVG